MGAPVSERKFNICDRCFASVPVSQVFCPECGAPIVNEEHNTEGSDSAVYTELARANLLRMRGEWKQAEDQCINILKRFPNNASANTLLGDISAEQGDLTQAVQWYELSLDLLPEDDAVKGKLKAVRERIDLHETATTAKELGLPNSGNRKNLYIAVILALVLLVGGAGYVFGSKRGETNAKHTTLTSTVKVPPQGSGDDGADTSAGGIGEESRTGGGDVLLLKRLASATPDGAKVLTVFQDPRNKAATVIYTTGDSDYKALGARLAKSLLEVESDSLNVTVRAMRAGSLVYTADVLRSRMNETTTQSWLAQNQSDPNAWIDFVLMNEWTGGTKKEETSAKPRDEEAKKTPEAPAKEPESAPKSTGKNSEEPAPDKAAPPTAKTESGN